MLVIISAPIFRLGIILIGTTSICPPDPRRQNGPMLVAIRVKRRRKCGGKSWKNPSSFAEHSAMASLAGGIFHLRKMDPERRDLFFNEVST